MFSLFFFLPFFLLSTCCLGTLKAAGCLLNGVNAKFRHAAALYTSSSGYLRQMCLQLMKGHRLTHHHLGPDYHYLKKKQTNKKNHKHTNTCL